MRTHYIVGDHVVPVEVRKGKDAGRFTVTVDGAVREVELVRGLGGQIQFRIDDRLVRAFTAQDGDRRFVRVAGGATVEFDVGDSVRKRARSGADEGVLAASMHSQVVAVEVAVGDVVSTGDTLVVLEAMKMETRLVASRDGVVKSLSCAAGDVVEPGVPLIEVE